MEVEEETTSNHLQESIAAETTTTVISEILLENTTSIDKQSEKQLSNLAPESNSQEEKDSSVSVPKSEGSEAFVSAAAGEKVEEPVHCRNSESVAALSGGGDNSVVVVSMSVVQDSKDADDGAVKEIDVAAVECGGSELTYAVKDGGDEGGEAVVERIGDPEVVEEMVGNDGDDTNVGEFLETEKDENEGNEIMVGMEGKPEDEKETVKEEEDAEVLKVGDDGGVLSSPVVLVHNDGGDEMTDQSKNDGGLNVRSEDVENVQGMVGSDVKNDGHGDAQIENIDNLQEDEAVAEEPVVPEIVKEEDNVSDEDVREDQQEEASVANEETVDGVGENEEEEPMEEDEEKSLDTDIETEKSLDIEMESVKSLDTEMETEEEINLEDEEKVQEADIETEPELPESSKKDSGGKRKRGGKLSKTTTKKTMEEDVCFICFDGGNLVLCDRRNCPKAYHPSCVNRDEAFFQSKGSWNCGWHLCSICEKKAEYMCYTCTYSVCKSCIKTSDMLCVREKEKKGLCEACMRTVMLIENPENQENANFDDESSWEYLFKDYWTETKAKHDLSLSELIQAKKQESSITQSDVKDEGNSDNPPENPSARKTRRQTKKQKSDAISDDSAPEWVSKELLEFITHMKNGDSSVISQYEVQDLLLEYIKRNKLRDPNKKSQIICDTRLETLFGKPRVAHIEMLKLLESHFLTKEDSQVDDFQGSVVDDDETNETLGKDQKDKKRKGRKKGDKKEPQTNRDDYATIDIHNINLIYLRRKLVEDLLDDMEMFHHKIVGTFVRIRVSGANKNQDIYRLVQVTGTSEAAEYTLGKRTTCAMLEILNLNKTEIIPIDTISNQEFTEDECKRLRQSIKLGLINRLTVGDILDKAMELQVARVNDWLETEVVRLNHLRDRASDLGRFKELKECVEKLNLLKGPEERARRLEEFPLVHDDPTMDPEYESEEDTNSDDNKRQELYKRSDSFGFNKRGRDQFSPRGDYNYSYNSNSNSNSKESWSGTPRNSRKNYEFTRNHSNKNMSSFENIENSRDHEQQRAPFVQQPIKSEKPNLVVNIETSVSNPKVNESDKMWHYKDPSGKIQGPFSLVKLRNWSKNGYFPDHLKIWKKNLKEDDGILLRDALEGNFQNNPNPTPVNRPGPDFANTPVKSSAGQSPTPTPTPNTGSTSVGPPFVPCGNNDMNAAGTSVAPVPVPVAPENIVAAPGGSVALPPQMVQAASGQSQSQIQNPQGWNGGGPQVIPMAGMGMQPMVYNQWSGGPAMVQDPAGNFLPQPMAAVAAPPQQFPFPVNQNMQQPNVNWGTMGMNPNMVWAGPNPGMAWGPMVQGPQVTGTMDPNWVQVPGWVPQPPVPGVGVAAPNQTWVAPPNGNPGWVGPVQGGWNQGNVNVNTGWNQGGAPGTNMGWVQGTIPTPTPTPAPAPTPIPTPMPPGNSNQNWGPRNQGNWGGNERGGFSGQRRNRGSGFHGGNNRRSYNNNNNNNNNSNNKQESFHKDGRLSSSFHGGSSGDPAPAPAPAPAPSDQ
ncbi:zinc finger CCCH domain-containing protein 19 [Lactuca sativa]|uniref:zinc finger CCCH domain-containing protein 19 n=1 Tax=Lactuca sativa TaxID=4236 RepID=UPI000CD8269F|nr:zinc finger CCCH domain-containing protein 19 [Lactuca sativa]